MEHATTVALAITAMAEKRMPIAYTTYNGGGGG